MGRATTDGLFPYREVRTPGFFRGNWESACNNTVTDILGDG